MKPIQLKDKRDAARFRIGPVVVLPHGPQRGFKRFRGGHLTVVGVDAKRGTITV